MRGIANGCLLPGAVVWREAEKNHEPPVKKKEKNQKKVWRTFFWRLLYGGSRAGMRGTANGRLLPEAAFWREAEKIMSRP